MEARVFWLSPFDEPFKPKTKDRLRQADLKLQCPDFEGSSLRGIKDPAELVPYLAGPLLVDRRVTFADENSFQLLCQDANGSVESMDGLSEEAAIQRILDC
jgi:hypothetical protein